ncbi:MAG: hypothetical protein K2Q12_01290, partial [Rickettsiales bacterium]|nr:hypothetical protein [Rickettsiales bacterium]
AGAGADTINGGDGANTLIGGEGADSLIGGTGADTLLGGDGNDTITSGAVGTDLIDGGTGNDTLTLTVAGTVIGGLGDDNVTITAAGSVQGGEGNDTILGGTGNLSAQGGAGTDSITGAAGTDSIAGEAGNDTIIGGAAADTLDGGADDDRISGGAAVDSLTGGAGADRFLFAVAEVGADAGAPATGDTITDFTSTDLFDFSDLTNTALRGTGVSFQRGDASVGATVLGADTGFFLATNTFVGTTEANIITGISGIATDAISAAEGTFYLAFSDNTNSYIVRIEENADTTLATADLVQYVATLSGVNTATLATFTAANFVDFV